MKMELQHKKGFTGGGASNSAQSQSKMTASPYLRCYYITLKTIPTGNVLKVIVDKGPNR